MGTSDIREPIQKRSIIKKEKIIQAGFDLICSKGFYNINTVQIAKKAGVSTGIVYQYFKDKHDIFICGLEKYADAIFYPMLEISETKFDKKDFPKIIRNMINQYITNHKLSETAHEEITAMTHSDKDVAFYFHKREMDMTIKIAQILENNGYNYNYMIERVHIMIGIIDNLCHEIVYHKHTNVNYDIMIDLVINSIINILEAQA